MALTELNNILSKNELVNNVFVYGAEEFLVEDTINQILAKFYPEKSNNYSFNKIDATTTPLGSMVDLANTFSLLGDNTLIVCKNIDEYFKGKKNKKDKELQKFLSYIKNPLDTTICIFSSQNDKLISSKTKKLPSPYGEIIDSFDSIAFPKIWPNQLPEWTINRFAKNGINISSQIIEIILTQTPNNLRDINNQIEKIKTASIDSEINDENILNVIGSSRKYNVYELQKAITSRKLTNALDIAENIYKNSKESLTAIISILSNYFIKVLKLKEIKKYGINQFDMARQLGVPNFFLKDYLVSVDLFSIQELENLFILLAEADFNFKYKNENKLIVVQKLIIDMIG